MIKHDVIINDLKMEMTDLNAKATLSYCKNELSHKIDVLDILLM